MGRAGRLYQAAFKGEGRSLNRELWKELKEELTAALHAESHTSDEELYDMIDRCILEYGKTRYLPLRERLGLRSGLFDSFRRLGVLQELVDDPEVTEIMVNGPEQIFVERRGRMEAWDKNFESVEQLEDMIQQIVSRVNRVVNVSRPVADARLPDGSRVHIVLPPIALDGPSVTVRKFPEPITMGRLIRFGSITDEAAVFLRKLVEAGYNIFICGGTNSGKSTFLNALSACIPSDERLVTIEDSAELQIRNVPNLVRLETRGPNGEGEGAVTIGDLIRAALRMSPNRIIVGEVRGSEAVDMVSAMNTGHNGSLSTGHGNNPGDMLSRLETMMLMGIELPLPAIRRQLASALDVMIHLSRLRDRSRRVLSIVEVEGYEGGEIKLNPIYEFQEESFDNEMMKESEAMGPIKETAKWEEFNGQGGINGESGKDGQNGRAGQTDQEIRTGQKKHWDPSGQFNRINYNIRNGKSGQAKGVRGRLKKVGKLKNTEKLRSAAISL